MLLAVHDGFDVDAGALFGPLRDQRHEFGPVLHARLIGREPDICFQIGPLHRVRHLLEVFLTDRGHDDVAVPRLHWYEDRAPLLARELGFLALEYHQVQHRIHQRYVDGLSLSGPFAMDKCGLDRPEGVGTGENVMRGGRRAIRR